MRTVRLIGINLKKTVTGCGFSACVLLTVILFITSPLTYDSNTDTSVSILQSFLRLSRGEMLRDPVYCTHSVLRSCVSGWVKMLIPMTTAFPFIPLYCRERETGALRFVSVRLSKQGHQTSTFFSAMLTGGLVMLCAFLLFALFTVTAFPDISEYETAHLMQPETGGGICRTAVLRAAELFLYGAVSAVPACLMTCLLNNRYLVISIPFFLKYLLIQHIVQQQTAVYENYADIDESRLAFLTMIDPDAVSRLFSGGDDLRNHVLLYAGLLIAAFLIFSMILNRRCDCGA